MASAEAETEGDKHIDLKLLRSLPPCTSGTCYDASSMANRALQFKKMSTFKNSLEKEDE